MFRDLFINYFRKLTATGILLGVDDAEDALAARISQAQAEPQPRTVLLAEARRVEHTNGRKPRRIGR